MIGADLLRGGAPPPDVHLDQGIGDVREKIHRHEHKAIDSQDHQGDADDAGGDTPPDGVGGDFHLPAPPWAFTSMPSLSFSLPAVTTVSPG